MSAGPASAKDASMGALASEVFICVFSIEQQKREKLHSGFLSVGEMKRTGCSQFDISSNQLVVLA